MAGPATGVGGGRRVRGGGFRTAKAVEPRTVASTLPPLSVAPRFPDSADRQVSESNSRSFTSASLFSPPHYFVLSVTLFLSPSSTSIPLSRCLSFSFFSSLSLSPFHSFSLTLSRHRCSTPPRLHSRFTCHRRRRLFPRFSANDTNGYVQACAGAYPGVVPHDQIAG